MIPFIQAHQTSFSLIGLWLFSGLMSSMPPLPEKAGYMTTWLHAFLQFAAANLNKAKEPAISLPVE